MSLSISIAMCTYNGGRFITEQLASIASQERPPDELIICDDGSTDGTHETVERFCRSCGFVTKIVINDHKLGSTKNFERAISLCHGQIVALSDQDDIWYPQKLKRIETAFGEPSASVGAFSDADIIDENSQPVDGGLWKAFAFNAKQQGRFQSERALEVLAKHPVVTGATMAFRRELFDVVAPIPSNHVHDRWISFLLAACGELRAIPEPLIRYRRHTAQQEGLPPQKYAELITQAKSRGAEYHIEEIERFRTLYERLKQREGYFPYARTALDQIERKISHLALRSQLPRKRFGRIPIVLRESMNLAYWRYSSGWNSIGRDLLIP